MGVTGSKLRWLKVSGFDRLDLMLSLLPRCVRLVHATYADTAVRFLAKVNRSGPIIRPELGRCWSWTASTRDKGYGQFGFPGLVGPRAASRVSYMLFKGAVADNILVCHKCDNPNCVRPKHLFLGSYSDNQQDMRSKGRAPDQTRSDWADWARGKNHWSAKHPERVQKGSQCGRAKLNERDVLAIRAEFSEGLVTKAELARRYRVSEYTIFKIVNGIGWRHV